MRKLALIVLTAFALSGTAQGISFSSTATGTAWNGSPDYVSVSNSSFSSLTVGQGDATITGTHGGMAEMFTPTSAFTLGSFNLVLSINNATTYQFHLYDLGPAGTVPVGTTTAAITNGTDLFSVSDTSLALSTSGGLVQGTFTLANPVPLLANEQYVLEIWTPSAAGSAGIVWQRSGLTTQLDPGGQMFSSGNAAGGIFNTLAGNGQAGGAPRTGGLALYVVPEPSTLALAGLSLIGGALMIRRRRN